MGPNWNDIWYLWSTFLSTWNRFRTGQSRCAANLVRWIRPQTRLAYVETLDGQWDHIVNHSPITRFPGGLWSLRQADEDAISWLGSRHAKQTIEEESGKIGRLNRCRMK